MVVSPSSGKIFAIRPHNWGREEALTWLEQGECLLTDGLVDPPLGVLHGEEWVTIFVREHDLGCLVAKREVKQESAPPPDPLPQRKPVSDADANREFDKWRESRGDNIPSEKEDIDYMRQFGVSRNRVRKMRQRPGVKRRPTGNRRLP